LQSEPLCKIPHVADGKDRAVVMAGLIIKLGLQILYLCKIPQFVVQAGSGRHLEVKRGGFYRALSQDGEERR
jgi:hypothetical protein